MIDIVFESQELQIKTNSTLGSYDLIYVNLYDNEDTEEKGTIVIQFADTMMFFVRFCSYNHEPFDTEPPTEVEKTWRIWEKSDHSTLFIACNDVQVLTYVYHARAQYYASTCDALSRADISGFQFGYDADYAMVTDSASRSYRVVGEKFYFYYI